jgi:UDP-N-acetylglucosamine 2-epimerase
MRILIVGEGGSPHPLALALEAAGAAVVRPPESAPGTSDGDQVGELAAALTAFERLLAGDPPDAVLLVSATDPALAAVLVASKLRIPMAAALAEAASQDHAAELNARLIERLADGTVGDDAGAIASLMRDLIAA